MNEEPSATFTCDLVLPEFQSLFAPIVTFMDYERKTDGSKSSFPETRNKLLSDFGLIDRGESMTQNLKKGNNNEMSLADWRWAASKRYWDPARRCWNEELGGMKGYIAQRNKRRAERRRRYSQVTIQQESARTTSQSRLAELNCEGDEFSVGEVRYGGPAPHELKSPIRRRSNVDAGNFALGTGQPLLDFMAKYGWDHLAVRGFWSAGYRAEPVVRLLNELPSSLHAAICEAIECAQFSAECAANFSSDAFNTGVLTDMGFPELGKSAAPEWEGDSVHAFLELCFDPDTQIRVSASANTRAANLLGMQLQELLDRLEQYDAPLPLGPLDAIAMFLHALSVARDDVNTYYYRLLPSAGLTGSSQSTPGRKSPPPAVLVCGTTVKDFDAFGRVHKVARQLSPNLSPALLPYHRKRMLPPERFQSFQHQRLLQDFISTCVLTPCGRMPRRRRGPRSESLPPTSTTPPPGCTRPSALSLRSATRAAAAGCCWRPRTTRRADSPPRWRPSAAAAAAAGMVGLSSTPRLP